MTRTFKWSAASVVLAALIGLLAYNAFISTAEAEGTKAAAGKGSMIPLKDSIKPDMVYATVNDEKVTGVDVQKFIKKLPEQLQTVPAGQIMPMVVNQLVNDKLASAAAAKANLEQDAMVQERLAMAHDQIIRDRYIEKALDSKVTDAVIEAKYKELIAKMPNEEEARARHILVAEEKTAKEVIEKLNKGEDFASLAKQYSSDPTKNNGGDLGYFVKSAMVKEFGDAVFSMKKGEVTKTPVKTQFGYHVIKVEDRRNKAKPTLAQVKDQVKAQVAEEEVKKLVEQLRKENKVEINLPK